MTVDLTRTRPVRSTLRSPRPAARRALRSPAHDVRGDAARFLSRLLGQRIEAVRADESDRTTIVTSRASVIVCRDLQLEGRDLEAAVGMIVVGTRLDTDASLTLQIATPGISAPVSLSVAPDWLLRAPRGAALAGSTGGQVRVRHETGTAFATSDRISSWLSARPTMRELEVLRAARTAPLGMDEIVTALRSAGHPSDDDVRRAGIDLLGGLLVRGELLAGTVEAGSFVPIERPATDIVEHIGTLWTALGGLSRQLSCIGRFAITDAGLEALRRG